MVLIGALLLCHGALGSLHQFHCVPEQDLVVAEHGQHHHEHGASDSNAPGLMGCVGAFFALLFWLVYGMLRRETGVRIAPPASGISGMFALAESPNLPRGSAFSLLQVFRL